MNDGFDVLYFKNKGNCKACGTYNKELCNYAKTHNIFRKNDAWADKDGYSDTAKREVDLGGDDIIRNFNSDLRIAETTGCILKVHPKYRLHQSFKSRKEGMFASVNPQFKQILEILEEKGEVKHFDLVTYMQAFEHIKAREANSLFEHLIDANLIERSLTETTLSSDAKTNKKWIGWFRGYANY